MASNWPVGAAALRAALQNPVGDVDAGDLDLFIGAACEMVDRKTGRDLDPTRWETAGQVPTIFILAARETAKLWWQQTKNGPRARPTGEHDGPPMGADLPRKVQSWLADYPPRIYVEET